MQRDESTPPWTLSCGHEIPRFEHQRRDKPPRRCPVCSTLQNVEVTVRPSGELYYECKRCRFGSFSEDEVNGHHCRPVWYWVKAALSTFPWG